MVGDSSFLKYYVCCYSGGNPYSDEMRAMPDVYWLTQFNFLRTKQLYEWKNLWEPQGELIGSIADPQVFQEYMKMKKTRARSEAVTDAMKNPEGEYDGFMGASTTHHFDPSRGMVNENNEVIVPKDEFEKSNNIGGIAVSY